jgi:hypothetical protein
MPDHAALHPPRHPGQFRLVVGRLPERAQRHRRGLDRAQTLAPDVPDDRPYAVRGVQHRVEVAADLRRVGGGDIARGQQDAADMRPGRPQQRQLGRLGDGADGDQVPGALHPQLGDDGPGHGQRRVGDQGPVEEPLVVVVVQAVVVAQADQHEHAQGAGEHDLQRIQGERGQRRHHRHQRRQIRVRAGDQVEEDHQPHRGQRRQHPQPERGLQQRGVVPQA